MRAYIELNSIRDVKEFTQLVQTVDVDVRLVGKDENGNDWSLSAKSLLCSLVMSAKLQKGCLRFWHNLASQKKRMSGCSLL